MRGYRAYILSLAFGVCLAAIAILVSPQVAQGATGHGVRSDMDGVNVRRHGLGLQRLSWHCCRSRVRHAGQHYIDHEYGLVGRKCHAEHDVLLRGESLCGHGMQRAVQRGGGHRPFGIRRPKRPHWLRRIGSLIPWHRGAHNHEAD